MKGHFYRFLFEVGGTLPLNKKYYRKLSCKGETDQFSSLRDPSLYTERHPVASKKEFTVLKHYSLVEKCREEEDIVYYTNIITLSFSFVLQL